MERILREPDLAQIEERFNRSFDLSSGTVYFPVRHHSPACTLYLQKTISLYKPDIILIEGPSEASHLIPYIADPDSVPPFCIYYSYDDKEGKVNDRREKYRAYYPFLEYSPEYAAIRRAVELNIPVAFIDRPYASRLVNKPESTELQYSFNENKEYEVNRYTSMLARKSGCRSFSEFWESRFELPAPNTELREFVRSVFFMAYFMRLTTPPDDENFREDLRREKYMADRIAEARAIHNRVLAVTGAFHVCGLMNPAQNLPASKQHNPNLTASYLMPYTFHELDSKNGYAAGMPYPAYYQQVWKKLKEGKKNAYETVALEFIVKTARYARKTQVVSVPDEINALNMARSLAVLRGKPAPGVCELTDGVRSAFVKGDINSTSTFELDFLFRLLSGMGAGKVVANDCVPPVINDFRALCSKHRIKTGTIERQHITLEILKKPAHYDKSKFLHQLDFLNTGFCKLESGPDYVNNKDKTWCGKYGSAVTAAG